MSARKKGNWTVKINYTGEISCEEMLLKVIKLYLEGVEDAARQRNRDLCQGKQG